MELARAEFTAIKATRIVSLDGSQCMNFQAGETLSVPNNMFSVAVGAGLVPEGPLTLPDEPEKLASDKEIVSEGLVEACKTLIARGVTTDFTLPGYPKTASIKKLVDFSFNVRELERAFERAMHEVEQDGNESTEHTEPSSATA